MSRGNSSSTWRPVGVWSVVTATASVVAASAPGQWPASKVDDLVVAVCTTGLALALGWLWVITTVTVVGLLTGRLRSGGGATRRLVLFACGAAVLAGTGVPALASGGDGNDLLVGLTLPDRAVAPQRVHRTREAPRHPAAPETYVVRPGDSLWSIARAHPDSSGSVDQRWRAIWRANRDVVGDDPDLIIPDQVLRLPTQRAQDEPQHPSQDPYSDGDR